MARDAGPPPAGAEEAEEQEQEQQKKGPGFVVPLAICLGVAVVAAGGGYGVFRWVLQPRMTIEEDAEEVPPDEPGVIYNMEQMTVNISGDMGNEFLLTKISFECVDQAAFDRVEANKARIRSALNALLSAKSVNDTQGVVAQERLQREIRDKVNAVLRNTDVKDVFFYDLTVAPM